MYPYHTPMSSYFLKPLLMLLLFFYMETSMVGSNWATKLEETKCIRSERQALLKLKEGFDDSYGILSTWQNESKDCCRWKGVRCSDETGHIQKLHLPGVQSKGMVQYALGGVIDPSLIELNHLVYLDLSYNYFSGILIPEFLGSLGSLRFLNLSYSGFVGDIPHQLGSLSHLQFLDLSYNYLEDIPHQLGNLKSLQSLSLAFNYGLKMSRSEWLSNLSSLAHLDLRSLGTLNHSSPWLEVIGKLPNLRDLLLSGNNLSDSDLVLSLSPSNMSNSSSLSILDLSSNMLMSSSTLFQWVSNFGSNLHELYLEHNHLKGAIPDDFGKTMNSLKHLNLSGNELEGNIPSSLGNICTLQVLDLHDNSLSGGLSGFASNTSRCNSHNALNCLDLSHNLITGVLPAELSSFSSLEEFSIKNNQLNGSIPESIRFLSKLKSLYLTNNSLEGVITETHLGNLFNLEVLELSHNFLTLKFHSNWAPPFQLKFLETASCKLGPDFPMWIQTQKNLFRLDISDAGISNTVPKEFWNLPSQLLYLNISKNNLKGSIPCLSLEFTNKPAIDLSSNEFEGAVPPFLLKASQLHLSENKFSDLAPFLCGNNTAENMYFLGLSSNQFSGKLPDCWNHLSSLGFLDLSSNRFSGKIPASMGKLVRMVYLALRNNSFTGKLPSSMKNLSELIVLDLEENQLSGSIPSWIGEILNKLAILSLRANQFQGTMPSKLCYLVQIHFLDLSMNHITGEIPKCLNNFTVMAQNSFQKSEAIHPWFAHEGVRSDFDAVMMWKGAKREFKNPDLMLKSIDLSSNHLTGEMPEEVGLILGLISLNLSKNNLTGEIISGIGDLKFLEVLDLSRNHFSGRIPSNLSDIDDLSVLDLSFNLLSGKIPEGTHLRTFDASSYEGNLDLCGEPLEKICPEEEQTTPAHSQPQEDDDKTSEFFEAFYMSMGIGFAVGLWVFLGPILLNRSWRSTYLRFLNNLVDREYLADR